MRSGLIVLCAIAAIAGAISGAEPAGSGILDAFWCAAFSVLLVLAGSRARRLPTTVLAGVAGVLGVGGDPAGLAFGALALLGAFYTAFTRARERLSGGAVGLVAGQALLRGTTYGFSGLPTLVAVAVVVPVLISAWRLSRTTERRVAKWVALSLGLLVLAGAATAGAAAVASRSHLDRASDLAEQGLDELSDGDTEKAAATFTRSADQFDQASSRLEGPLGLLGRVVPVVAQNLEAVRRVSASGQHLGEAAATAAGTADWRKLTASGGSVDLDAVRAMQQPVEASAASLDAALVTVAEVRSPWLIGPLDTKLDSLTDRLADAADEASIAADGLTVVPSLLGGDGPKRYFVAFATPGESRNAGGFAGAFGILDAVDGQLSFVRSGATMSDLDPVDGRVYSLDLSEEWRSIYGGYDVERFPGNLTASPDWPTDADVAGQIYAESVGGSPVDGVIYADPAALAALLELTGPVRVPGVPEPLDAENVEQYLLVDQYVQFDGESQDRKELLGEVADAVFEALTRKPLPGIRKITDVLGPAVSAQHLRVTMLSPGPDQDFLERVGLTGAFGARPGADLLSLRSSNLLTTKIDRFLSRNVGTSIDIDPSTGAIRTTVEVTLTNSAPDSGLPNYLIGNGSEVPRGTNRDLLTLYSPLALDGVEVDGQAARVQTHLELGLNSYGVPVDIPAGASVRLVFRLAGPPPAGLTDSGVYELYVIPQPLANPDEWRIAVTSAGRELATSNGPLQQTLKFSVDVADGG